VRCAEVRELLPSYVREGHAEAEVKEHLETCHACNEELSRYVALAGSLASMQEITADVPPDLSQRLFAIPSEDSRFGVVKDHVTRNRAAYLGGAAAALAGIGVAAWRVRPPPPPEQKLTPPIQ
jgi:predicted anti-sigma-YlaC factor YlaD